jgi:hypothetical protein
MNAFASALAGLNDAMLSTFADPVTITLTDNTALIVPGIFAREEDDVQPNVAPSWRYTVTVKTADVQGFAVASGNTIEVAGVVYTIIKPPIPDDGGMTKYVVKRYG